MSRSPIPAPVYALLCIILSALFFAFTLRSFADAAPLKTYGSPAPSAIMMSKAKMAASGYCLTLVRNPNVGVWSESGGPTFEWRQGGCIPKWEDCVDAALAAMKESEFYLWTACRRRLIIDSLGAHENEDYFVGIHERGVARGCGAVAVWS
ncbi:MAG: hypothetical protein Q9160_009048 [Pyrenula sp. 1 TL-2023]